jgi:hypothetical protein
MLSGSGGMRAGSMIVVNFTLRCCTATTHRSPLPSRHADGDDASLFSMVSRVPSRWSAIRHLLFYGSPARDKRNPLFDPLNLATCC